MQAVEQLAKREFLGVGFQSWVYKARRISNPREELVLKMPTLGWLVAAALLTQEPGFVQQRYKRGLKLMNEYFPEFSVPTRLRCSDGQSAPIIVQQFIPIFTPVNAATSRDTPVYNDLKRFAEKSRALYRENDGFGFDLLGGDLLHRLPRKMRIDQNYWALSNLTVIDGRIRLCDLGCFEFGRPRTLLDRLVRGLYMPVMKQVENRVGLSFHQ